MTTSYRPELDVTPELSDADASYYQSLIGILRWIVELGRVDICLEVSMMSLHLALPRIGHLHQVLQFGHGRKLVSKNRLIQIWSYMFLYRRRCHGSAVKISLRTSRWGVEFLHFLMSKTFLFMEQALIDQIGDDSEVGLLTDGKHRFGNSE